MHTNCHVRVVTRVLRVAEASSRSVIDELVVHTVVLCSSPTDSSTLSSDDRTDAETEENSFVLLCFSSSSKSLWLRSTSASTEGCG